MDEVASELAHLEVPLGRYQGLYHGLKVVDGRFEYVTSVLPSGEGLVRAVRYCRVDGFFSEPRALCVVRAGVRLVQLDVNLKTREITEGERKWVLGDESFQKPRAVVWDYDTMSDPLTPFNRFDTTWTAKELADAADPITILKQRMLAVTREAQLTIETSGTVNRTLPNKAASFLRANTEWTQVDSCSASLLPIFDTRPSSQRIVHYRNYVTRQYLTYDIDTLVIVTPWASF